MRETANNLPQQRIYHVMCSDTLMYGNEGLVKVHSTSTGKLICYTALPALCWQDYNNCTSNRILVIQICT